MPRAHRHFLPGHLWHITHRCHGKEFLLGDEYDRRQWVSWLARAKERYRLVVLGYSVTCNHIHLLIQDPGPAGAIARSMQLVQGRVAQSYNKRTERINAFWGDRYHATAIESGAHLLRCLAYIDLNMVRAGVVKHPQEWRDSGYHEIHDDRIRNGVVDRQRLGMLLGCRDLDALRKLHRRLIDETISRDQLTRDCQWSESLAVGSQLFVNNFAAALGERLGARSAEAIDAEESYAVRESSVTGYGNCLQESGSVAFVGDNTCEFDLDIS